MVIKKQIIGIFFVILTISFINAYSVNIPINPNPINIGGNCTCSINQSWVNNNFYPLNSNPLGFITGYSESDPFFIAWLNLKNFYNQTGDKYLYSSGQTIYINISSFDDRYAHGSFINYFYNSTSSDVTTYFIMNSSLPQISNQYTFTSGNLNNGDIIKSWINSNTNLTFIPEGVIHYHYHLQKSLGAMTLQVYAELYKNSSGVETLLSTSETSDALTLGSEQDTDLHAVINDTYLNIADKLVVKLRAVVNGIGVAPQIQIFTEGTTASRVELPVTISSVSSSSTNANFTNVCWLNVTNQNLTLYNLSVTNLTVNGWNIIKGATPVFYTNTSMGFNVNNTYMMLGMGNFINMTPLTSGNVRFKVQFINSMLATAGNGINIKLAYGTGTAPARNTTASGTVVGLPMSQTNGGSSTAIVIITDDVIVKGLTVGTNYWFDMQFSSNNLGAGGISEPVTNMQSSLEELPY